MSFRPPAVALGFSIANVLLAVFLVVAVFVVLPARWWVVDVPAGLVVALLFGSTVGLLRRDGRGLRVAAAAAAVVLVVGMLAFAALCLAAAFVSGVHGVLGVGVSLAYLLIIVPVWTYLVLLPALQLAWIRGRLKAT